MGRKFIGIELDEDYYNISIKRITEAYRQKDLFIDNARDTIKPESPFLPGM